MCVDCHFFGTHSFSAGVRNLSPTTTAGGEAGAEAKRELRPISSLLRPNVSLGGPGSSDRKGEGAAGGDGTKGCRRRESSATTTEVGDERHSGDNSVGGPAAGKPHGLAGAGVIEAVYPPTNNLR